MVTDMKNKIMHFNSTKERLEYLKNGLTEIIPKEVEKKTEKKPKKAGKAKKKDEVQAE